MSAPNIRALRFFSAGLPSASGLGAGRLVARSSASCCWRRRSSLGCAWSWDCVVRFSQWQANNVHVYHCCDGCTCVHCGCSTTTHQWRPCFSVHHHCRLQPPFAPNLMCCVPDQHLVQGVPVAVGPSPRCGYAPCAARPPPHRRHRCVRRDQRGWDRGVALHLLRCVARSTVAPGDQWI